jgi:hypothetical protein
MSERRSRFEKLERPRRDGPDGDERPSTGERFGDMAGGAAAPGSPAPRAPGSAGDRFREPVARSPEVAPAGDEEQPFIRCRRCETDNSRYGTACTTCGDDLHGPEQRAFNEALWAERRRQRGEEERQSAARRAAAAEEAEAAARAQRAAAEELAREVGHRERSRLESDGWASGGGGGRWGDPWGGDFGMDRTPVAIRLLRSIRDPRWRVAAIVGYIGLVVACFALALVNRAFLLGGFVLLMLVLPGSAWRTRRRWWW